MGAAAVMTAISLVATPAHALDWNTRRLVEEFTDAQSCRVEPSGEFFALVLAKHSARHGWTSIARRSHRL